jgi:hypothetical protein
MADFKNLFFLTFNFISYYNGFFFFNIADIKKKLIFFLQVQKELNPYR